MEKNLYTKYIFQNTNKDISITPLKSNFNKYYNKKCIKLHKDYIEYNNYILYKIKNPSDELFSFESYYYTTKNIKDIYINYIDQFIYLIVYNDNSYQLVESDNYCPINIVEIGIISDISIMYNMYSYLKSFY